MISAVFIIGMIYFYTMTGKSNIVQQYRSSLSPELLIRYDTIAKERMTISYQGYMLGFILSLLIIYYHSKTKMSTISLVCTVIATASITNYFYYMLHRKSDWMLNHVREKKDVEKWLQMYRSMSYNYHSGLALGIIAVAVFAFAFRC
jgi:uncharacterized protein YacL